MAKVREEVNNLKHNNEDLLKQVEGLQMNRFSEVEELVYLRWVNACLRYELRNYQTPAGKISARDLSKNLSPKSQAKAKQLMLEYAGSERGQGDTDVESNFSQPSSPGSDDFDNASMDSSTSRFSSFSKKPGLIQKLKRWGKSKDDSSVQSSPSRSFYGGSPGRLSVSMNKQRGPLESLMIRNAGESVAITTFGKVDQETPGTPETPNLPRIRTQQASSPGEPLNSVAASFHVMSKSVDGVLDEKYPAYKDRHKLAVEREKHIKHKADQARAERFGGNVALPPKLAQLKEKSVLVPSVRSVTTSDQSNDGNDGKASENSQAVTKMKLVDIEKRPPRVPRPPPRSSGGNSTNMPSPRPPLPGGGPPPPPPPPGRGPPPPPGSGPPPPPPPPGALGRGAASGNKVHRAPELVEFYQSLMKRDAKKDGASLISSGTGNSSEARSNMIGEIENRSTFLLAVSSHFYLNRINILLMQLEFK